MQKRTVYLLQDTKETVDELTTLFESSGFIVVGGSTDGIKAMSEVPEKKPEIFITELVLKGYDGLAVINKIRELGLDTKIIVLSAMTSEEVISVATNAGANYFMAKPYDFNLLKQRIIDICEGKERFKDSSVNLVSGFHRTSLEEKISKIFINVGIPPHIKGYSFLRERRLYHDFKKNRKKEMYILW